MISLLPFSKKTSQKVEMAFFGDKKVLHNILLKKQLLDKKDPEHKNIKTVLIFPGGGQRGVVQGGVVAALEKLGLVDAFDYMIGISAGAAAPYYLLAGEAATGVAIYFNDNIQNHFVSFLRPWKILDIKVVEKTFREIKPIDIDRFRKSRPHFLIGVTDLNTGKEKFVDAKAANDPIKVLIASLSAPLATGLKIGNVEHIDGKLCVDGCPGNPLPISYAIEHIGATDILVVMTSPLEYTKDHSTVKKLLDKTFFKEFSFGLRWDLDHYNQRYNHELQYLKGDIQVPQGVHLGAIYPKIMPIHATTMNKELLEQGALTSLEFTQHLFQN